jgi:phosphomannomutase
MAVVGLEQLRVRAWIADDPDPVTRAEAETLLRLAESGDADAEARLRDAFDGRLVFGTAGLRAEQGAGPMRMNRVVVAQTSAGLAAYLLQRAEAGGERPSAVVGYDARVNSDVFARDVAEVLAGAGVRVVLFPEPAPTPVTAFAVRHLDASAGVMVTASHNPPRDNGYKAFLGGADGGGQLVPPADREISERIEEAARTLFADLPRSSDYEVAGPELVDAYVTAAAEIMRARARAGSGSLGAEPLVAVYTAMHGVGASVTRRLLAAAGLPEVVAVAEQDRPDGAFPTVEFPNPEEPEALDLAYRTARDCGAQLVIAHDPDADRLAVAAPHPDSVGGYRRLSGNELGLLLGWRAAEREHTAALREGRAVRGALANTIVSSPSLRAVAEAYGLEHVETLSGSKWLARVPGLLFGFEEALGYLVAPGLVPDKDGVMAAAEVLALANELHAQGRTIWQLLDEASERFGHFASAQVAVRCGKRAEVEALAARVRERPPTGFGAAAVREARDLLTPGAAAVPADVLAYDLEGGSRVMIRPSGTEPKLKVYLDAFCDEGSAADRRAAAAAELEGIEAAVRAYLEEAAS